MGLLTHAFLCRRPLLALLRAVYQFKDYPANEVVVMPSQLRRDLGQAALGLLVAETDLRVPFPHSVWALDASPTHGAFVKASVMGE